MDLLKGKDLENLLKKNQTLASYQKRDCYEKLWKYLSNNEHRLMALYGLRRTGKTVMMQQAVRELDDYEHTCWITCEHGDSMQILKKALNQNPDCRNVFIDEITYLDNFIDASSILANKYTEEEGRKIVMTGTDSLGFLFSSCHELFDRVVLLHTTYIPFPEYARLKQKNDMDIYIEYGGTLTDGRLFYNRNEDNTFIYTNSAIVENIQHSLEYWDDGRRFGSLLPFYNRNELTTFLNKIIEYDNHTFLIRTVNEKFKSHTMISLRKNLERNPEVNEDLTVLKSKELNQDIMDALAIKEPLFNVADEKAIAQAKTYLKALDLIYIVPDTQDEEVIFTQPGLRYAQVETMIDTLSKSEAMKKNYTLSFIKQIQKKLEEIVKGKMMEDIVYYHIAKDAKLQEKFQLTKYRDAYGKAEFDIVLIDPDVDEAYLLEVKHSQKYYPSGQAKHLANKEACSILEDALHVKIAGKAIIYRGKDEDCIQGIKYFNVLSFMKNPMKHLKEMRKEYISTPTLVI